MIFLLAFLGGLLLNFMPCVLPVVSLKALSLNDDHKWFAAGMLTVFAGLASLAAGLGFAWGEHFNYQPFTIGMAALVYAMGLSYLGMYDILVPGFRGEASSSFGRGVICTVLATPCSGPFLGPVFAACLRQPPVTVFSIFMLIGLGMATPYLFMSKIKRFIPKPGAWMETLKQIGGFMLIGTSIWLLHSVADRWLFPTIILFLAMTIGCFYRKLPANIAAAIIAVLPFALSTETLPWQPYNVIRLQEAQSTGQVVLIDFTAPWCATCQMNAAILNTAPVRRVVQQHNVMCLEADMSDPACEELLRQLGGNSIPMLAIFPRSGPPTVIPDLISKHTVISALEFAAQ